MTRLLVVDDHDENLYLLRVLLESQGFGVELAHNGAEALEKARQDPPDLIISDILMPVMDGFTLCRHWKADDRLGRVPFIFYTATYTDPKDEQLALDLGADAFIAKPAEPEDFLAAVLAVLARAEAGQPVSPKEPRGEDRSILRHYSEALVRKLEDKMLQFEKANEALEQQIAERMQAEEALRATIAELVAANVERAWLAWAIEQTADAVWMQDVDKTVRYANRSFSRLYGYEPDEIIGRYAGILNSGRQERAFFDEIWASVVAGKTWTGSIVNRRKDGTLVEVEAVISGIRDAAGRLVNYMQTDRDVTRERILESALARDARERETIEAALAQIDPADQPEVIAATACAEIVRLPGIDSAWAIGLWGNHGRVLAAAGRIGLVLAAGTAVPDVRARHLRERASTGPWVEAWQARPDDGAFGDAITTTGLRSTVSAPLKSPHGIVGVIGFGAHDALKADQIIERLPALTTFGAIVGALIAPGLEARHREEDARASVHAIIDAADFTPFFQPIVEFRTGAVVGYEALSRFGNRIPPDATFALAVRVGLGIELEMATLRAALEAAAILPSRAYLSLNASPVLVGSGALRALLGGRERAIVLEITEHVVIDDYPALRHELDALGPTVRLAVDDAGAGYASLRHILELAPNFVKLDIGLIRGIDADPARQALTAGMGYFAVKRKLRLIAEGIETAAELQALREVGIGYGQGYLLGRPQDGRSPGPWPSKIVLPAS